MWDKLNPKELYDDYYKDENKEFEHWRRTGAIDKANNIVSFGSDVRPKTILEIGAGDGAILIRLNEMRFGDELFAIEISKSGVASIVDKKISNLSEARLFDGVSIPYPTDKFDLVVLSHVLEHAEHPRRLLQEAARVGKCVFIEVPLEYRWLSPSHFQLDEVGHINFFSKRLMRFLLESSNLKIERERISNPSFEVYRLIRSWPSNYMHYLLKQWSLVISPSIATGLFTYHYSALCRPVK